MRQGAERAPNLEPLTWKPFEPTAVYEGRTLREWAVEWVRWSNAPTDCETPAFDDDGSLCGLYQDPESPVFFLQLGDEKTVRTRCEIPRDKAVLVPLFGVYLDKLGVWPDADTPDEELERMVADALASARDLKLSVEDYAIQGLKEWSVGLTKFDYNVPPEPNLYSCTGFPGITGNVSPAYMSGIFLLFPPPPPGTHTLEYGGLATLDGDDVSSYVTTTFRTSSN